MRQTLFFILLFVTVAGVSQSKKQLKFEAIERQRFEAMTTKNDAILENMLSDQLTYIHSNGLTENKQQHLDNIRSGKLNYRTMQPEEMKVKNFRKSAVITGIINVTGVLNEKEFAVRLRYLDVYVKEKGKWRLAAWQSQKL